MGINDSKLPFLGDLSSRIAGGAISPRQAVELCLERIDERDPDLHAWAYVAREQALAAADELGAELARGESRGPLHGVPFGAKDILDTAGIPTGFGSPLYAGHIPDQDAELIARLKEAGAILLGKTHTTAFAYFDPGPTRNPHHLEHTPGGSSSGSAAAIADGMVPFAIGSQTLGSVLRPASFCGIVGLKPTYGSLPGAGMLPFAPSLDHPGFFTRTVAEMAWLWQAVTGVAADSSSPRVLARPKWPIQGDLEPEMASGFAAALDSLSAAGFEVLAIELPESIAMLPDAILTVFRFEGAQTQGHRFEQYGSRIGEKLAALIGDGMKISRGSYEAAQAHLERARQDFAVMAEEHPLWVTPSALGPAPKGQAFTGDPRANAPFTALGVPAISLPIGLGAAGLPLGLQLAAAKGRENLLLAAGLECERVLAPRWVDGKR